MSAASGPGCVWPVAARIPVQYAVDMISVPLPFVVAILLAILLGVILARQARQDRPVIAFLTVALILMILVGLRWSVDAAVFRFLQPVVAAMMPATAWLCFARLRGPGRVPGWLHFLPAGIVLLLSAFWSRLHPPIDALLFVLFVTYGLLLLRNGRLGPDRLTAARFGDASLAGRAAMVAGGLLVFSGLIDLAIALDFGLGDGSHAARLVSAGNLTLVPLIAWALVLMGQSALPASSPDPSPEIVPRGSPPDDERVLADLDRLLTETALYRDPDLNLDRLSRRLAVPARQLSGAINRKLGQNVSQAINGWRIREAMQLLAETDRQVTAIMFDCGFQTKSNFNREFRRVAGCSPSDWRRGARDARAGV